MKAHMVVVERAGRQSGNLKDARAIGAALPVAIPLGRTLGWTSERTYREAERWALRRPR
jgi:hypothetical protein